MDQAEDTADLRRRWHVPTLGLRCQELRQGRDVWCPFLGPYSHKAVFAVVRATGAGV